MPSPASHPTSPPPVSSSSPLPPAFPSPAIAAAGEHACLCPAFQCSRWCLAQQYHTDLHVEQKLSAALPHTAHGSSGGLVSFCSATASLGGGGGEHADEALEGLVEVRAIFREKLLLRASLVEEITDPGLHQRWPNTGTEGEVAQCPESLHPHFLGLVHRGTAQERGLDFVV